MATARNSTEFAMFDNVAKNMLVPLVLRFGLAVIFIYHGVEKVGASGGTAWHQPPDPSAEPQPVILQLLVAWGELLGGLAVAVGFLTRLAAAGLSVIMIGAIVTVHGKNGFSLQYGGFEYNFAILVICAALILIGPGRPSVDFHMLRKR